MRVQASYKDQVARLAEQLARLYKQQAGPWGVGGVDAAPLKMAAQEHARCAGLQDGLLLGVYNDR